MLSLLPALLLMALLAAASRLPGAAGSAAAAAGGAHVPAARKPLQSSLQEDHHHQKGPTGAGGRAAGAGPDVSIVISTIDGGVLTLDAWTGRSKGLFYSGPPLYSSSFFLEGAKQGRGGAGDGGGGGGDGGGGGPRVNPRNKYFVMPTLEGRIVCVRCVSLWYGGLTSCLCGRFLALTLIAMTHTHREDGTQEILAPNVLDLLDQPLMSCPDNEEACGLLLGEKTTKVFALDSSSGNLKWVNSKFKFGGGGGMGAGAGAGGGDEGPTAPPTATPAGGGAGGGKEPPILMQRDDYVVRSLNVQTGREEWNVTLSEIFAIGRAADGSAIGAAPAYGEGEDDGVDEEEEGSLPLLPDIDWLDERTLEVVDPETGKVLWARELHAAPIGMYTVMDNKWLHLELPSQSAGAAQAEPSRRVAGGRLLTAGDPPAAGGGSVVGARLLGSQLAGPLAPGGPIATARAARKYYGVGSIGAPPARVGLPRPGGGAGSGGGGGDCGDGEEEQEEDTKDGEGEERLVVRPRAGGDAFASLRRMLDYTPLARLMGSGGGRGGRKGASSSSLALVEQRPPQSRRPRRQRRCSEWELAHGRCRDPEMRGQTGDFGVYDVMVTSPFCPEGEEGECPQQPWELPEPPLRLGPPLPEPGKGLYMTFETLATLVIAVFVVGILFVVTVYQHQLGLGGGRAAGAGVGGKGHQQQQQQQLAQRGVDPGSETLQRLADLMLKHRAVSAAAASGLDPGASENTTATTVSTSTGSGSGSSLEGEAGAGMGAADASGRPFYQRGRPPLLALTGGTGSDANTPRPSPTRGAFVDGPSSRGSQGSASSAEGPLTRSSSMPVFAGVGGDSGSPDAHGTSTPGPQGPGGRGLLLDKSLHASMEGQPIQRLQAVYKKRSPPLSANGRGNGGGGGRAFFPENGTDSSASGRPPRVVPPPAVGLPSKLAAEGAMVSATGSAATTTTMALAQVPGGATMAAATAATETITDASGNPVLFLSTKRYTNEFRETCKLGRGGFGTVFKSTNKLDGHEYAIKKIRLSSAAAWSTQLEKVLREVKILALLDHPNIIRYYQAWLERLSPEELTAAAIAAANGATGGTGASASATLSLLAPGSTTGSHTLGGPHSTSFGGGLLRGSGAHDVSSSWGGLPAVGGGGNGGRRARRLNSSSLRFGDGEEEGEIEEDEEEEDDTEDGDEQDEDTLSSGGVGFRAPALPPRARPPLPPGGGGSTSVVAAALRRSASLQSDDHSRISQWSEEDEERSVASDSDGEEGSAAGARHRPSETDDDSQAGLVVWTRAGDGEDGGGPSRPGTPNDGGNGSAHSTPRRGERGHRPGSSSSRAPSSPYSSTSASAGARAGLASGRAGTGRGGGANGSSGGNGLRRGRGGGGGRGAMARRSSASASVEPVVFDLCLYIQMQFCSNRTLKDFLGLPERRHAVDKAQALQLALQIARGVQYVHERGLIHRDLKPTNCFLVGGGSTGSTGTVKIGDFGLSRHVGVAAGAAGAGGGAGEEGNPAPPLSPAGNARGRRGGRAGRYVDYDNTAGVGTPVYGSPEQLSGGDYDEKTDVFSLGVMLFELFHPAFGTGMERMLTMRRLHEGRLPEEWSQGNAELVDVLQRMLNRLPSRRPTAAEVVGKLEFLQGRPLVLPLEFDSFPRDAVLLRAETGERDGVLQEVISGIKAHGAPGLMKQYGFRSTSDGKAVIEVLLDGSGSRAGDIDRILAHLRALDDMLACNIVGLGPGGSSSSAGSTPAVSRATTVTVGEEGGQDGKKEEEAAGGGWERGNCGGGPGPVPVFGD